MIIDLNELNIKKEIKIAENISFIEKLPSIKSIQNARFVGKVYISITEEVKLEGNFKADLILYDSVDLSDYDYKIDLNIDEIVNLEQKTLDINQILWENIVLEVPIRATKCNDVHLKGEGWEIKDKESKDKEIDPRLEKLQELFKGGEQ